MLIETNFRTPPVVSWLLLYTLVNASFATAIFVVVESISIGTRITELAGFEETRHKGASVEKFYITVAGRSTSSSYCTTWRMHSDATDKSNSMAQDSSELH